MDTVHLQVRQPRGTQYPPSHRQTAGARPESQLSKQTTNVTRCLAGNHSRMSGTSKQKKEAAGILQLKSSWAHACVQLQRPGQLSKAQSQNKIFKRGPGAAPGRTLVSRV